MNEYIFTILGVITPAVLYFKKKYAAFLLSLIIVLTRGFGLIHVDMVISGLDAFLLVFLVCALKELAMDKSFFTIRDDWVATLIVVLLVYAFVIFCYSFLMDREGLAYGFKVFRLEFYFFAYFLFRKIPFEEVTKMFKWLIGISIVLGVLYYLQYVGIVGVLEVDEKYYRGMYKSGRNFNNTPVFSSLILLYLLFKKNKSVATYMLIIFFSGLLILPQSRGEIIAVLVAVALFFVMSGYFVRMFKVGIVVLIVGALFYSVLNERVKETEVKAGLTFTQEIKRGMKLIVNRDFKHVNDEGNFIFRMSILSERVVYLSKDMNRFWFGVGTIHEDSPANNFQFFLGSPKKGKMQIIDTDDVAFLSHVFRYGFMYLILMLSLIGVMLKRLFVNRERDILVLVAFVFLLKNCVHAMGSDRFSDLIHVFIPLLFVAQLYHHDKRLIFEHLW